MKYSDMKCEERGEVLTIKRNDKRFCSGRCKSKNFRRIQKEKMNLLERLFDRLPNQPSTVKLDLFA
jgi:hypothetical protein